MFDSRIRDRRGGCFRFRLQGISHSNKPVIRLKAIRKRKNSLRSDNFLFLVNAASQALTMTNTPSQSPSTFPPRLFRKVRQKGCICLVFCIQPIGGPFKQARNFRFCSGLYECLLKKDIAAEEKLTDRIRQQKKKILHKLCIDMERSEYTSFSMLAALKCEFPWTSILMSRYMDSRG